MSEPKKFSYVDVVISGFLQYEGKPNGMIRLWRELYKWASPKDLVLMKTWNDNMSDLAEFILRESDDETSIKIYGYSWGGAAAIKLARELKRRGRSVQHMVLSDAVYRHWFWLGNWRAFAWWRKLWVPDNVSEVHWFRQGANWPRGHDVVAVNSDDTLVNPPINVSVQHCYMDDLLKFHEKSLEISENY